MCQCIKKFWKGEKVLARKEKEKDVSTHTPPKQVGKMVWKVCTKE